MKLTIATGCRVMNEMFGAVMCSLSMSCWKQGLVVDVRDLHAAGLDELAHGPGRHPLALTRDRLVEGVHQPAPRGDAVVRHEHEVPEVNRDDLLPERRGERRVGSHDDEAGAAGQVEGAVAPLPALGHVEDQLGYPPQLDAEVREVHAGRRRIAVTVHAAVVEDAPVAGPGGGHRDRAVTTGDVLIALSVVITLPVDVRDDAPTERGGVDVGWRSGCHAWSLDARLPHVKRTVR